MSPQLQIIALNPDRILAYLNRAYLQHVFTSNSEALDLLEPGSELEYVSQDFFPDDFFHDKPQFLNEAQEVRVQNLRGVATSHDWIPQLEEAIQQGFVPNEEELRKFSRQCWRHILYERRPFHNSFTAFWGTE